MWRDRLVGCRGTVEAVRTKTTVIVVSHQTCIGKGGCSRSMQALWGLVVGATLLSEAAFLPKDGRSWYIVGAKLVPIAAIVSSFTVAWDRLSARVLCARLSDAGETYVDGALMRLLGVAESLLLHII